MGSTGKGRDSLAIVLKAVKSALIRCSAETGYGQLRIAISLYDRDWVTVQLRFGCERLFKIRRAEFSSTPLLPLDQGRSLSGLVALIDRAIRWCAEQGFGEVVIDVTPSRKGRGMLEAVISRATTVKFFFFREFDPLPA